MISPYREVRLPKVYWSDAEEFELKQLAQAGYDIEAIASQMERSAVSVRCKLYGLGLTAKDMRDAKRAKSDPISAAANATDKDSLIAQLMAENARLKAQITWAQQADAPERTGGTLTVFSSDWHKGDANHLIASFWNAHYKVLEIIRQYEPDHVNVIHGGDLVAGRGIYKEQDLDMAVSDPVQQCQLGAVSFYRFLKAIREVTESPVRVLTLRGNHSYTKGSSMAEYIQLVLDKLASTLPDVKTKFAGDRAIFNLAHEGIYNVLVMHGYGHSKVSASSPTFIQDCKDTLLNIARSSADPKEIPHRVLSGHTHWHMIGSEPVKNTFFDTAGGWQRNTRVKLGMNQRPTGLMCYISTPGLTDGILQPISIKPDVEVHNAEIEDASLLGKNQAYCGDLIIEYKRLCEEQGWTEPEGSHGMVHVGRW